MTDVFKIIVKYRRKIIAKYRHLSPSGNRAYVTAAYLDVRYIRNIGLFRT